MDNEMIEMSVEMTMAWLSNPSTRASSDEVVAFLNATHAAVSSLKAPVSAPLDEVEELPVKGMVTERASISSKDHIVSMIDGKKYRTLRRHLKSNGMTPEQYRKRFGLKDDYPMVAPSYSEQRSQLAKAIGLGRKAGTAAPERRQRNR